MRLRGAALTVIVALGAAGSAHAAPDALLYGPALSQPTALTTGTVVGTVDMVGRSDRYSVLSFGAGGTPSTLYRADATPTESGAAVHNAEYGYAASDSHLAVLRVESMVTEQSVAQSAGLGFGARSDLPVLPSVFACDSGGTPGPTFAVDGARVAMLADECGPMRLLVHEAGSTRTLPVAANTIDRSLELAGGYVAYEVSTPRGDGTYAGRTVVARADTGEEVFGVDGSASGFALAPDGTLVVAVTRRAIDRDQTCLSGQLFVATPAAPAPREVPGAQPCGRVELAGDRAVFRDPDAVLRATSLTGESVALASGVIGDAEFDGAPGRVALLMPSCAGSALYALALDGSSGEPEQVGPCTARLLSRNLRVSGRTASVRLDCPRGCMGSVSLSFAGGFRSIAGGPFFAAPGRRATVRLRLSRTVARSVRRRGRRPARLQVYLRLPVGPAIDRTVSVVLRRAS